MKIPNLSSRGSFGRSAALATLALTPLLASCASIGKRPHEATRHTYNIDAHNCVKQNTLQPKVRGNIAGNVGQPPSGGVDTQGYLRCMTLLGYHQEPKTDPLLRALDRCRQLAAGPKTATASSGGVTISSGVNQVDFQDCMKERGFGQVVIEPLQPLPGK